MARVICRNTFIDVVSSDECSPNKLLAPPLHPEGQRSRLNSAPGSAFIFFEPEEPAKEITEKQLRRLSRILNLDLADPRPFPDADATEQCQETNTANLCEMTELEVTLQQVLLPDACTNRKVLDSSIASTVSEDMTYTNIERCNGQTELVSEVRLTSATPQNTGILPTVPSARSPTSQDSIVPRSLDLTTQFGRPSDDTSPPTTLMLRHIPNRYTQREFVSELEEVGFADSFDFVYLPVDKCTRANLGYAFVNFVDSSWAEKCMNQFQDYRFKKQNDSFSKIAAVSVAHIQGLDDNVAYYANSAVNTSKNKRRRPLVLSRPEHGQGHLKELRQGKNSDKE